MYGCCRKRLHNDYAAGECSESGGGGTKQSNGCRESGDRFSVFSTQERSGVAGRALRGSVIIEQCFCENQFAGSGDSGILVTL